MQSKHGDAEENESAKLFDGDLVRDYLRFALGAVRRRKLLVGVVFVSMVAAAIAALWALPKTYRIESKLFAQRNQVLAVRGDGPDAVAPTRGAAETVERTQSLVAVIQATDLIRHHEEGRAPAQRALDATMRLLSSTIETDEDRLDAMVERLDRSLTVWTSEGVITIALEWPDAEMARTLVNALQQNFLETRYAQEITALAEASAIIASHASSLSADIDDAVATIEKLQGDKRAAFRSEDTAASSAAHRVIVPGPPAAERRPASSQASVILAAKQQAYDDIEGARRRRFAEVQARLVEQRAMYTEDHPAVRESRQALAVLSSESPYARTLAKDLAQLRGAADDAGGAGDALDGAAPQAPRAAFAPVPAARIRPPRDPARIDEALGDDRAPATVYARAQLLDAMEKHSALRSQVQAAAIDLQTAEAAFKYRYSVLTPAQLPRKPIKPNAFMIMIAAVMVGALASVLAAVLADLRAGRLLEPWQIERLLEQPILGELVLPRLPGHAAT